MDLWVVLELGLDLVLVGEHVFHLESVVAGLNSAGIGVGGGGFPSLSAPITMAAAVIFGWWAIGPVVCLTGGTVHTGRKRLEEKTASGRAVGRTRVARTVQDSCFGFIRISHRFRNLAKKAADRMHEYPDIHRINQLHI